MSVADTREATLREVPLSDLLRHPYQPRFDESEDLESLKESIESEGLIVPPTVVPHPKEGGKFYIVAGHRRVRAMRELGWSVTKVLVVPISHTDALAPLVENVVKKDLNAIEWAKSLAVAYEISGGEITYTELGRRIGKDRNFVAKSVRVGKLPKKFLETLYDMGVGRGRYERPYRFADNIKILDKVAACHEKRGAKAADRLVEKLRRKEEDEGFNRDLFLRLATLESEFDASALDSPPPSEAEVSSAGFGEDAASGPGDFGEDFPEFPELSPFDVEEIEPFEIDPLESAGEGEKPKERGEEKTLHKQDAGYLIEEFSDGSVRIRFDPKRLTAATASDLAYALRKYAADIS